MKTLTLSLLMVSLGGIPFRGAVARDTSAIDVKVYACKPSNGECNRIISYNHLAGISCDSVKTKYPVYFVVLRNLQLPAAMAASPAITVGDMAIAEWGGQDSIVFFGIYCDSVVESYAGKTVMIYPPDYPSSAGPVQKGLFPGRPIIDSLKSSAGSGIAALPTLFEVLGGKTSITGSSILTKDNQRHFSSGAFTPIKTFPCNIRGQRTGAGQPPGFYIIHRNGIWKKMAITRANASQ